MKRASGHVKHQQKKRWAENYAARLLDVNVQWLVVQLEMDQTFATSMANTSDSDQWTYALLHLFQCKWQTGTPGSFTLAGPPIASHYSSNHRKFETVLNSSFHQAIWENLYLRLLHRQPRWNLELERGRKNFRQFVLTFQAICRRKIGQMKYNRWNMCAGLSQLSAQAGGCYYLQERVDILASSQIASGKVLLDYPQGHYPSRQCTKNFDFSSNSRL